MLYLSCRGFFGLGCDLQTFIKGGFLWVLRVEAGDVNVCIDILPHHGELCQVECERLQVCLADLGVEEAEFRFTEEDIQ